MEPLRDEIQHFMSASEEILSFTVNASELSEMERDAILYYVFTIAQKFSNVCERDALEAVMRLFL
ncbi:MAG: hypothetical protein LV473_15790 [Nitrospira sp.]|nr:hypothetical protein [Nitrospira sp.]